MSTISQRQLGRDTCLHKQASHLLAIDICGGAGGWAIAARGLPIKIVAAIDHAEDCCAT